MIKSLPSQVLDMELSEVVELLLLQGCNPDYSSQALEYGLAQAILHFPDARRKWSFGRSRSRIWEETIDALQREGKLEHYPDKRLGLQEECKATIEDQLRQKYGSNIVKSLLPFSQEVRHYARLHG